MKHLFFLNIYFLGVLMTTAQEKKISLYPEGVPAENSIKYYLSLRKYKIPAEIHIWQRGIHGLGLAKEDELPFMNWPKTCERWMIDRKIIDKLPNN